MTMIEGIGDEVTHFFVAVFIILIVSFAWWSTSITEQRNVRTVLLLERRRHRTHRRLTTNTEAVTITEGTNNVAPTISEEPTSPSQSIDSKGSTSPEEKPPEPSTGSQARTGEVLSEETLESNLGEEQNIINTMDSDTCVLRQRRLAFYYNIGSSDGTSSTNSSTQSTELPQSSSSTTNQTGDIPGNETPCRIVEVVETPHPNSGPSGDKTGITIKLKYINDDVKLVDGKLDESLGDFKKRHFQPELAANKLVRLIFNGQVLQPDTQTLQSCGLFDNCVVHCLIHQRRAISNQSTEVETRSGGYSFPNTLGMHNLNNNDQNREWDLGNFLFAFISFILLAAWYFRYVYAHLYTVTATVGLILITGIFTIVLVGMYFPSDNENIPFPTIRITRERIQLQQ